MENKITKPGMRVLSLFSGIEAASVAFGSLGWEIVAFAEIDSFASAVLAHHYPNTPNLGNVENITERQIRALGHIDIVVFGSPCQDLSVAGQRKGFDEGSRSSLFFTAIRIVRWARINCKCRFAMWENVPGAFSSNQGRDFAAVVGEMAGLTNVPVPANGWGSEGAAVGALGLLEWCILDAQWFGVAQRRRRVFALADFGDWSNRPPILLERHSMRGDSPPSRETRQEIAGSLTSSLGRRGGAPDCGSTPGHLQPVAGTIQANGKAAGSATQQDAEAGLLVTVLAHGQGKAEVSFNRSPTLTCNHDAPIAVYSVALRGREGGATAELGDEVAGCLRASGGGGDKAHVLAPIAFDSRQDCVSSTEVFGALGSSSPQAQAVAMPFDTTHTLKAEGFDASEDGTGRGQPIVAVDTLYNTGFTQGYTDASPQEAHARTLLRALLQEVGEETFAKWGLGILDSLQSAEILRPDLHGSGVRQATRASGRVVGSARGCAFDSSTWLLQSLQQAGCTRCASQGWEPPEQLARELGTYLSELPQQGTPRARFLRDLWATSEGTRVLRQALSTLQEMGRPAHGQAQPVLPTYAVRRLTTKECARLQGFPDDYLDILVRGKPAADGPKYKALGNSWAVPNVRWIGERIDAALRQADVA